MHTSMRTAGTNMIASSFGEVIAIPLQLKNKNMSEGLMLSDILMMEESQNLLLIAKFNFICL